jgi:predicted  nucleic acid-binding Zn-ribbon protein
MTRSDRSSIQWLQGRLAESEAARRRLEGELDVERKARQSAEAQTERLLQEVPPHLAEDIRRQQLARWRGE